MEKGRKVADRPKALVSSVFAVANPECLGWDVEQNKNSFGTLCARKKILSPEHNKKRICLITVLSLVQTCKYYRHKGRTELLIFPLILKERVNQSNLRSCTDFFS